MTKYKLWHFCLKKIKVKQTNKKQFTYILMQFFSLHMHSTCLTNARLERILVLYNQFNILSSKNIHKWKSLHLSRAITISLWVRSFWGANKVGLKLIYARMVMIIPLTLKLYNFDVRGPFYSLLTNIEKRK